MFNKKTATTIIIASLLTLTASASFNKNLTYAENQFTDVPLSEWYAKEVASTYELGLMNGKGAGIFEPEGNVTVAEAIAMAARAASIYSGETVENTDGEWYHMYVNYAISKGFVKDGQFDDFNRPAKRHEVASLFKNAMPDGYFTAKNNVEKIPDVSLKKEYHSDLLTLYKAGVVMGSGSYGNFKPEDNITRAEAAAIINRVALPENRLSKTLDKISEDDAYLFNNTSTLAVSGGRNGTPSGWSFDNRGGQPTTDYKINLSAIKDKSDDEQVRLIKEFNKISTGIIQIETMVTFKSFEGFYFEVNNESGNAIYRIEVKDGAWNYLNADGSTAKICDAHTEETVLRINLDLDNGRVSTVIDDVAPYSGKLIQSGTDANITSFIYGSTEKGTADFQMNSSYAYVNYALYDDFKYVEDGKAAYNFLCDGASVEKGELVVSGAGKAERFFNAVSGNIIAEAKMFLNKNTFAEMSLLSGTKNIAKLSTDGSNILINGEAVYKYYDGLWYDIRFEFDTDKSEVVFKLNGIERTVVPFAESTTSIDNIVFSAEANSENVRIDNVRVFKKIQHDDYVPVPVKPAGEEKYNVGINVCSLWVEGNHYGWETISRFDEPILGYYTEGIPETADWEIKYMVEHGIDFQAFCWYSFNRAPVKEHELHSHLDYGFKNAEYSNMMKYALLLELTNKAIDLESWEKFTVPYITEHYFKDPRYMSIENKAVVCAFQLGSLLKPTAMGSADNVKKALDLLEQAAIDCGYDGMIFMSCASGITKAEEAAMGVDVSYNYHFGTDGSRYDTNTTANIYQAKDKATHTVPTASVGFQSVGWLDARYPLMNTKDYAKLNKWVADEFLPTFADEDENWKSNTVMLSTWNEFGEGTYINPTKNNGGFGYLDGVREAYTDEKADESINTVPTDEQKRRINRMYPSYKQMLMHKGYVSKTAEKEIIFEVDGTTNTAIKASQMKDVKQDKNGIGGIASGNDPRFVLEMFGDKVKTKNVSAIRVTLKVPKGSTVELYFKTSEDNNYNQNKWLTAEATEDGYSTITFNVSSHNSWAGLLTGLFVDPIRNDGEGKECILKKVEILGKKDLGLVRKMTINGLKFDTNFAPVEASNGDILVPFDLTLGLEYKLDSFVEWNKDTETITINGEGKSISFTIGSNKYTVDGKEYVLDYEIPEIDGLPMIPFNVMCDVLGYEYNYSEEGISVDVPEFAGLYDSISDSAWEFDIMGFLGGWNSSNTTLESHPDGYLVMSNETGTDPMMFNNFVKPLPAKKYKELHVRLKFDYAGPVSWSQLFWATNKNNSWSEERSAKIFIGELSTDDKWKEYKIDLTKIEGWSDNITKLRFDSFNSQGTMEIDYIRLIEDPDYVPDEEEEIEEPTGHITISNGDFEGVDGFTSPERFEIVEDPDNADNHVLKIMPDGDGKKWVYATHKVRFVPGQTYKVSLDHKLASIGIDETAATGDIKCVLICNIQYSKTSGGSKDHLVKQFYVTPKWTHTEFTFTVDEDSDIRSDDTLSFYTNPYAENGVGYYLDNITIKEVE